MCTPIKVPLPPKQLPNANLKIKLKLFNPMCICKLFMNVNLRENQWVQWKLKLKVKINLKAIDIFIAI